MTTKRFVPVKRLALATAAAALALTGCGLAETTAVTAAQAEAAVQQAKEGKKLEEKVQRDIAAAQAKTAESLKNAEAQSE
jgi:hypothetical protein